MRARAIGSGDSLIVGEVLTTEIIYLIFGTEGTLG